MANTPKDEPKKTVQPANNVASNEAPLPEPKEALETLRNEPVESKKESQLTWKQKLEKGIPLNQFDEVKADADFNYKRNLREQAERREHEQMKARANGEVR